MDAGPDRFEGNGRVGTGRDGHDDPVRLCEEVGERRPVPDSQLCRNGAATPPIHVEDTRMGHAFQVADQPGVVSAKRTDADDA